MSIEAVVGVRASDGRLMWHYGRAANNVDNIATLTAHDTKAK